MENDSVHTIIEYRLDGKLKEAHFDEAAPYIEACMYRLYEHGASDFVVIKNRKQLNLSYLNDLV